LSAFPSPPRSNPNFNSQNRRPSVDGRPLPSPPSKEIVMRCRDSPRRKTSRGNGDMVIGTRMQKVELNKPLPPTPLVTFRNNWHDAPHSWVDEKWLTPPSDAEKEGWL